MVCTDLIDQVGGGVRKVKKQWNVEMETVIFKKKIWEKVDEMIFFVFEILFLFCDYDDLIYQDLSTSLEIDICFFTFGSMPDFHILMSTIYIYLHHPFAAGPPKKGHFANINDSLWISHGNGLEDHLRTCKWLARITPMYGAVETRPFRRPPCMEPLRPGHLEDPHVWSRWDQAI